jgi:WG containing repeat
MKILLNLLSLLFLCSFSALHAQEASESFASKKTLPIASGSTSKITKVMNVTEEARHHYMALFNLYRDFTVTIDTLSLQKEERLGSNTEVTKPIFGAYLDKMDGILLKKMDKIPANTPQTRSEQSYYLAGLSLLKSAKCFQSDNQANAFVRGQDMDNNSMMSFDLTTLRGNGRYGLIENYKEGFARIRKDQVYGFLNLCGEEAITCQYERAEPFNAGQALAKRVDWFFVDAEGNESESLENVADAKSLKNGVSWVRMNNNKQALIDNNYGKMKVSLSQYYDAVDSFFQKDVFRVRNGKKMGLIGLNGKTIFDAIYDNIEPTNVRGVYHIVQNKNIGLLDTTWAIRTSPTYESISDFNIFGIALVKNQKGFAFVSAKDFKMTKYYAYVTEHNDFGVSIVRNEGNLYGLIDSNLNVIVQPKYASIGTFNDLGLASACYPDGKCGFIKYDGKEQIKANYTSVTDFNMYGLAVATTMLENCDEKEGNCKVEIVIDRNGNTIVPISDESIKNKWHYQLSDSLHAGERFIIINVVEETKVKYLLVRKDNFQLITGTAYQALTAMDQLGNLRVKKDNKWGIIDSAGKVLAKPLYEEIKRQTDGFYATQNDKGRWGFLNKKGKAQIPFEYEEVRNYRLGYAPVSKGKGKWGLITHFNAKIVPCAFRSINLNDKESKYEVKDEDNTVFIINYKGECETNCPKFEEIRAKANKASEIEKK